MRLINLALLALSLVHWWVRLEAVRSGWKRLGARCG